MRVYINPTYTGPDRADGGIRRVVEAQVQYLPEFGIEIANSPNEADLIANHGAGLVEAPGRPMVCHNHGLMWSEYHFGDWGDKINKHCIDVMTRAQAITAPSRWVAHAISRGILASPEVVYHGIDADDWDHNQSNLGYVLWNKARADKVSDPADMNDVAQRLPHIPFLATRGEFASNTYIVGVKPYQEMKPIIQRAAVYLATARETFGVGTLEAMAAGVPVAGWRYGGQEEIVVEGKTGYLAEWGDYDGLARAIERCFIERARLSANCRADVRARWGWRDKIAQYADLYFRVAHGWYQPRPKVSVIITCYNLARYLPEAIQSVRNQTLTDWECIIVDDQSADGSRAIADLAALDDQRFSAYTPERNLGLSGARNFGFQQSNGKYILFLDADDRLAPNALDQLTTYLDQRSDAHIAYGHLDIMSDDGTNQRRNPWPGDHFDWTWQIAHNNQLPYASLMRREVLVRSGGYRIRDWRAEDASFWARVTSFGFRAAKATEDSTLIYRIRGSSKSAEEARAHEDRDGNWCGWLPWALAGTAADGVRAIESGARPPMMLVPFGAQGEPPAPAHAWRVPHHQHPLISVIIPVGPGHEGVLIDALDSLVAQTWQEWEAIVVNDTGAPLHVDGHPHARVVSTRMREGAGAARNAGIAEARAPLCFFLDADDILVPRALETMVRAYIAHDGERYIYSDWGHIENDRRWDSMVTIHPSRPFDPQAWLDAMQCPVSVLIDTATAREVPFDTTLPAWEDWDWMIRLTIAGHCGAHVEEPLLIYRATTGQRRRFARSDETGEFTEAGAALLESIRQRYYAYGIGEKPMCGCRGRGGNKQTVAQATQFINDLHPVTLSAPEDVELIAPASNGMVRMEFIGDQWGGVTYPSRDRQRSYVAGRNPHERFLDVDPRDVEWLESFGVFQRVIFPPEVVQEEEMDATPPDEAEMTITQQRAALFEVPA